MKIKNICCIGADISLANTKLNWNPKCDIEDGLLNTIKYFKNINEIN